METWNELPIVYSVFFLNPNMYQLSYYGRFSVVDLSRVEFEKKLYWPAKFVVVQKGSVAER